MWFKIDLSGIVLELQIRGYSSLRNEDEYVRWCRTDFSFSSKSWLSYRKTDDEVMDCGEIEGLAFRIDKLLKDELDSVTKMSCIEPDFLFIFQPKRDIRNDPNVAYVAPGHEIEDIHMEWRIAFWDDGLTENYLSVRLYRQDLELFKAYLYLVMGKNDMSSPEIINMINCGMLYGSL